MAGTGRTPFEPFQSRSIPPIPISLTNWSHGEAARPRQRIDTGKRDPVTADRGKASLPAHRIDGMSDSEIAQFVIFALERALAAVCDEDPETSIRLSACESRRAIRSRFAAVPRGQQDQKLQRDYHEAILFQNRTLDLALEIVTAVRRYASARSNVS